MKIGLRHKLSEYLKEKQGQWIHGGQLERFAQGEGFEGETAKRRLREMTQREHPAFDPKIKEKKENGCIVYSYESTQGAGKASDWSHNPDQAGSIPAPATKCCESYRLIKRHASNCEKVITKIQLCTPLLQ